MSKKHFIVIAAACARISDLVERKRMAETLCEVFKTLNPLFDRRRFLVACGIPADAV